MNSARPGLAAAVTVALMLGSAPTAPAQTIYRIVAPDGKVTFSDQAPASATSVTARSASGKPVDASAQNAALPYALRQVVARYPVTLYAGAGCVPCNAGRLMLQSRGIPYTEYTVATNDDIEALQRLSGEKSLPLLTIGGQKIKGYVEAEWTQFLNAANYPTTSQLPGNYQFAAARPLVATQKLASAPEPAVARTAGEQPVAGPTQPTAEAEPSTSNPAGIRF